MTTPNIPQWVQEAIAKIAKTHNILEPRGDHYDEGFTDGMESAKNIFLREFERAEPQSGWISVADRLPENSGKYLVFKSEPTFNNQVIEEVGTSEFFSDLKTFPKLHYVTHWQPLPQPQKQEHENDE